MVVEKRDLIFVFSSEETYRKVLDSFRDLINEDDNVELDRLKM